VSLKRALVAALAALWLVGGGARAEFVPEVVGQVATLPAPGPHWIWVADLLLRRAALVDTDTGTFLGMLSSSVGAITPLVAPAGGAIYLPETCVQPRQPGRAHGRRDRLRPTTARAARQRSRSRPSARTSCTAPGSPRCSTTGASRRCST
jgi:hypothetical protein